MREKILEIFPELELITDEDLREKTLNVWVEAMELGGWKIEDLEEIPFTLLIPDTQITLVKHTRAVTQIAIEAAKVFDNIYGAELEVNMDYLISGALLHDVGKLLEYERTDAGKIVKCHFGKMMRHPFSGASLAYKFELPPEVCHIIAVHAREGTKNRAIPEAIIVNHADFINFESMKSKLLGEII
jgi:putative nucleotidyltransferase with HDIG domain